MTARHTHWAPAVLLIAALCAAPLVLDGYGLSLATTAVIYAVFALGLQWLVGGAGLISLGHAASFGIGAYAATLLSPSGAAANALWLWPAAMLAAGLFAAVTGALALRTRGLYFLMVTLAFSQMAYYLVHDARWSGGSDGLYLYVRPALQLGELAWSLGDPVAYYLACLACLLLSWALLATLARCRWGRLLDGMRQDESRLRACGANPSGPALAAYTIAGMLGGLAGALHAGQDGYITPALLSWEQSGLVLLMVVLGGSRHRWGAVAGAIAVLLIQEAAQQWAADWGWEEHWQLGYGLALIALVLLLPQGLASVSALWSSRQLNTQALAPAPSPLSPCQPQPSTTAPVAAPPHDESANIVTATPTDAAAACRPAGAASQRGASTASRPLLAAAGLTRRFGGLVALHSVTLALHDRSNHALIGTNGAGKSTLLHLLSGDLAADGGTLRLAGQDITGWPAHRRVRAGLCRSDQHARIFPELTVMENVRLAALAARPRTTARRISRAARLALARTGLSAWADTAAHALPHGARKRLNIALCLATRARVLLLDEPLAGLGTDEAAAMRTCIAALRRRHAILLVEHDMDAVFDLADTVTVLVDGEVIAQGLPAAIQADPAVRRAYLGTA